MLNGFEGTGTVLNRNSIVSPGDNHSGRRRTVRTDQNKQNLKAVLDRDATKEIGDATKSPVSSARRNVLHLTKSSFSRLVSDLNYHPYKVIRRHELKPGDFVKRRAFCTWFIGLPAAEQLNMLVSDEANFLLSGHVNSHNVVRYSLDRMGRPEQHAVDKVAYSPKLMAFAGIRNGGTFGVTIYRNQTMNGRVYNDLLVNSVLPELKGLNGGVLDPFIWQQDGAPCTVI